jgi:Co/Zn/Cd efflux system component
MSGLFRKEIDLAKREASEKFSFAVGGIEMLVVGMVLAIGAIGVLLSALVSGIASFFVHQGMTEPSANSLAAVIVGLVVAGLAWMSMSRGLSILRGTDLSLDRTGRSLRRDAEVVKENLS